MKGDRYQHTQTERINETMGTKVVQLTSLPGNHHHLYFTSSSFTRNNKEVIFISDHGGANPNLFLMTLNDGIALQLTDNRDGFMRSYVYYDGNVNRGLAKASPSYDPHTHSLLYIMNNQVHLLNLATFEDKVLYILPSHVMTGFTHFSADGRLVCIPFIDSNAFDVGPGNPFTLIREKVFNEKMASRLLVIDTLAGTSKIRFAQVGWITHVQFHPSNSDLILYNHEGGMVGQRMWLYDHGSKKTVKIRDQTVDETKLWICHEMWLDNGKAVLYHGTSGVPNDPAMRDLEKRSSEIISFVGRVELGTGKRVELTFPPEMKAYGHFMASANGETLVTDGVIDAKSIHLCKVDWDKGELNWTLLCSHNSSFLTQDVHPHPIFSHDDGLLLFTSDAHNEQTKGNLYLVELI